MYNQTVIYPQLYLSECQSYYDRRIQHHGVKYRSAAQTWVWDDQKD